MAGKVVQGAGRIEGRVDATASGVRVVQGSGRITGHAHLTATGVRVLSGAMMAGPATLSGQATFTPPGEATRQFVQLLSDLYDVLTHAWLLGSPMLGKLGHDTSNLEMLVALALVSLYVAKRHLQSDRR